MIKTGKLSRQNGAELSAVVKCHAARLLTNSSSVERSLVRLLLKEDPKIIESGTDALLDAVRKMAVLHVATTVRHTYLMSLRQGHG